MKILVVFDTRYGNTMKLARAAAEGARAAGAETRVARCAIVEPEEIIQKNDRWKAVHAEFEKIPQVTTDDFAWADGYLWGSPTRFGNMTAPMKAVVDALSGHWLKGTLIGKPVGLFTSTSSMHGGQETTLLSMMFPFLHHGAIIVGVPYSEQRLVTTARGGTPYGATSVSGPAADQGPNEDELEIARTQGRRMAEIAGRLRK